MSDCLRIFIVFIILISHPVIIHAKEIKYNHNSITIDQIKSKVDFKVLSPQKLPDDWTLEIKTYPMNEDEHFTHFSLHYMDKDDIVLKVGIEQRKEPVIKKKVVIPYAEKIDINGSEGIFEAWGNSGEIDNKGELVTGGLLTWKQNGTYVQMYSSRIPKETMINIARSMK